MPRAVSASRHMRYHPKSYQRMDEDPQQKEGQVQGMRKQESNGVFAGWQSQDEMPTSDQAGTQVWHTNFGEPGLPQTSECCRGCGIDRNQCLHGSLARFSSGRSPAGNCGRVFSWGRQQFDFGCASDSHSRCQRAGLPLQHPRVEAVWHEMFQQAEGQFACQMRHRVSAGLSPQPWLFGVLWSKV